MLLKFTLRKNLTLLYVYYTSETAIQTSNFKLLFLIYSGHVLINVRLITHFRNTQKFFFFHFRTFILYIRVESLMCALHVFVCFSLHRYLFVNYVSLVIEYLKYNFRFDWIWTRNIWTMSYHTSVQYFIYFLIVAVLPDQF